MEDVISAPELVGSSVLVFFNCWHSAFALALSSALAFFLSSFSSFLFSCQMKGGVVLLFYYTHFEITGDLCNAIGP